MVAPPSFIDDALDVSNVTGNATDAVKRVAIRPPNIVYPPNAQGERRGFADHITRRLKLIDATFLPHPDEKEKEQHRLIYELTVEEDMMNTASTLHGGCTAYLVDLCSSLAILCHTFHEAQKLVLSVSQSMNIVYHAPAPLNTRLRIVNHTISMGRRVNTAKTDIWDIDKHRLIASGTHVKMIPSAAKL